MRLDGFEDAGFTDLWTPVALSSEVGTKPVPLRLASERLVLFRGPDGQVGAHNGMARPLSSVPGRTLFALLWCVPVDGHTTRMFFANARDFGRHNPLFRLLEHFNRIVILEDRRLVETSVPVEVPPPAGEERSVATDRATLAFRRWYLERRRGARAAGPSDDATGHDTPGTALTSLAG